MRLNGDDMGKKDEEVSKECNKLLERINQLEEQLRQKDAFIEALVSSVPKPIFLYFIDTEGKLRYISEYNLEFYGKNLDEVIGKRPSEIFLDPTGQRTMAEAGMKTMIETALENGGMKIENKEVKLNTEKGLLHILTSCAPVKVNGKLEGMVGFYVDVTPIKQKEEEAKRAYEMIREVFKNMPFPAYVLFVNREHKVQYANDEIAKLAGYSKAEEIIGLQPSELFKTEGGRTVADKVLDTGKAVVGIQAVTRTKDGREIPVLVSCVPVYIDGEMAGVIDVFIDITELKEKEDEIMRTLNYTDNALELLTVGIRELQAGNLNARVEKPPRVEGVKVAERFEETVDYFNEFAERLQEIVRKLAED
ncbi:PAS domain-containing protein, partial [Archaeoglobus sp.]|uniref:PAS domain-containing protein n=1 Tax=Archaeoglobus sp. TaxID=1872626 RepID=UPI0025C27673